MSDLRERLEELEQKLTAIVNAGDESSQGHLDALREVLAHPERLIESLRCAPTESREAVVRECAELFPDAHEWLTAKTARDRILKLLEPK